MIYEEIVEGKTIVLKVTIEKEGNKWTYTVSHENGSNPIKVVDYKNNGELFVFDSHNRDASFKHRKLKEIAESIFTKEELYRADGSFDYSLVRDIEDILRKVEYRFNIQLKDPEYQIKLLEETIEEIDYSSNISYIELVDKAGLSTDNVRQLETLKDIIMNHIVKNREDCQRINDGQFKKIRIKSPSKITFNIESNQLYYEKEDVIKKKELKQFLFKAEKLPINKDMIFLPFKINNNAYLIIIDNLFEGLSITDVKGNFKYFNKQSKLYQIIYRNTNESLKNDGTILNDYLDYLSLNLRKKAGHNGKLLRTIWGNKFKDILKSSYLSKEFTDKQ